MMYNEEEFHLDGRVLVTGAGGHVGTELVHELANLGVETRAGIHHWTDRDKVQINGVEPVDIDFYDHNSLDRALEGVRKVFLLTPFGPDMEEQVENTVEACIRAKVEHIVRLSVFRAELKSGPALTQMHNRCEDIVQGSGLEWTILRPNVYMQNLLRFADSIRCEHKFYSVKGDARVSYIDVRDVALCAAQVLVDSSHIGNAYNLTGPESLDMTHIAHIFSDVLGRRVSYKKVKEDEARQWMREAGMSTWDIDVIMDWYELQQQGHYAEVTGVVEYLTNRNPINFDRFVRDHIQLFKPEMVEAVR